MATTMTETIVTATEPGENRTVRAEAAATEQTTPEAPESPPTPARPEPGSFRPLYEAWQERTREAERTHQRAQNAYNRRNPNDRRANAYVNARRSFGQAMDYSSYSREEKIRLAEELGRAALDYATNFEDHEADLNAARDAYNAEVEQAKVDFIAATGDDPLVRWLVTDVWGSYPSYAASVLQVLPATMDAINEVARQGDWCSEYNRLVEQAERAGVTDAPSLIPDEDEQGGETFTVVGTTVDSEPRAYVATPGTGEGIERNPNRRTWVMQVEAQNVQAAMRVAEKRRRRQQHARR